VGMKGEKESEWGGRERRRVSGEEGRREGRVESGLGGSESVERKERRKLASLCNK
jgi:hypothetical protein